MMKNLQSFSLENSFEKNAVEFLVKDDLKMKYSNLLKSNLEKDTKENKVIQLFPKIWKVAAIGIFMCSAMFLFKSTSDNPEHLAMNFAIETTLLGNQDVMRKDHHLSDNIRLEANAKFVKGNYNEAIASYQKLTSLNKAKDIDHFYLAICFLKSDNPNPQKALVELDFVKSNTLLTNEIIWFKSLAYVMSGQLSKGEALLLQIVDQNIYKVDEAKKLLASISENRIP
jgi:tetratricopeptide (TPR) repeat protein